MGSAQGSFDIRYNIITGVGIRDQISIKALKQFPGVLTAPATGIKEKCAWISSLATLRMTHIRPVLLLIVRIRKCHILQRIKWIIRFLFM